MTEAKALSDDLSRETIRRILAQRVCRYCPSGPLSDIAYKLLDQVRELQAQLAEARQEG